MEDWFNANKEWLFGGIGITVLTFVATLFNKYLLKKLTTIIKRVFSKQKNIILRITDGMDKVPFSLLSTSVDLKSEVRRRLEIDGRIIIKCKEFARVKKMMKRIKDNADINSLDAYQRAIEQKLSNIIIMIELGVKDDNIYRRMESFTDYVDGIVGLEFFYLRRCHHASKEDFVKLDIYLHRMNFSIYLQREQYMQILKSTDEQIEIASMIICDEVFEDASIFDRIILPEYSRKLLSMQTENKSYVSEDVGSMYISVG